MGRELLFKIFRMDPTQKDAKPHIQEFKLEEVPGFSIYYALKQIRETIDPTLKFDFACTASVCGSCAMLINGRPKLGCKTLTKTLPAKIELYPLPTFKLIGDLSVDTGTWFRQMAINLESWIHTDKEFDPAALEERMSNKKAYEIYELDRCIECGICIASCATVNIRESFVGAAALLRVARFMIDPRDHRELQHFYDVVGTDEGMFGCMGLMACEDNCPKEIPLQQQLAFVRRKMAIHGVFNAHSLQKEKSDHK